MCKQWTIDIIMNSTIGRNRCANLWLNWKQSLYRSGRFIILIGFLCYWKLNNKTFNFESLVDDSCRFPFYAITELQHLVLCFHKLSHRFSKKVDPRKPLVEAHILRSFACFCAAFINMQSRAISFDWIDKYASKRLDFAVFAINIILI